VVLGVPAAAPVQTSLQRSLGRLPVYFMANGGVYPQAVRYSIQGADKTRRERMILFGERRWHRAAREFLDPGLE